MLIIIIIFTMCIEYAKSDYEKALIRMDFESEFYEYSVHPETRELCTFLSSFQSREFDKIWVKTYCEPYIHDWLIDTVSNMTGEEFFSKLSTKNTLHAVQNKDARTLGWLNEGICDFSSPCQYGSMTTTWHWINGIADDYRWRTSTHTYKTPSWPAIGFYDPETWPGTLYSDMLPCLEEGSYFTFKFWLSKSASLKVCFLSIVTVNLTWCSQMYTQVDTVYDNTINIPIINSTEDRHMVIFYGVVSRGFIILDDLGYVGKRCDAEENAVSYIYHQNWMHLSVNFHVRNQLMHMLIRNNAYFSDYLEDLLNMQYEFDENSYDKEICQVVPCTFKDGWCNYEGDYGALKFSMGQNFVTTGFSMFTQLSPMFVYHAGYITFAIMTSPAFAPSTNRTLTFKYSRAIHNRPLYICFYDHEHLIGECRQNVLALPDNEYLWVTNKVAIPDGTTQFQFVTLQNELVIDGSTKAVILNFDVEKCSRSIWDK